MLYENWDKYADSERLYSDLLAYKLRSGATDSDTRIMYIRSRIAFACLKLVSQYVLNECVNSLYELQ